MANPITQIIIAAVDRTKAAFASVKGGLGSIGESANGLKSTLGSIFTGLSVVGFIGQIKKVADEMDGALESAQAAGTSVENFTGLAYASGTAGGGTEVLQKSLVKINKSLEDSAVAGSTAAATWRDLGLDPKQFDDPADALLAIADRFAAMPDGIRKTNLAIDLFGEKIGPRMIPLLNKGRAGIKELTDEAQRLGKVLDTETAEAADRFNDTLARLDARKVSIFARMLPSIEQYVSALDDVLERGSALEKIAFFTTGFISEESMNRISDAGERVQDYNAQIFKLQQQLLELRRVEAAGSPNIGIWEKKIAELEKTRADLAKKANAERVKDSKKTTDELGKDYQTDAQNFKKANDEKINDAQRLQDALQTAFGNALDNEKRYRKEAASLRTQASAQGSGDQSQESIRADATFAAMELERIKQNGNPDEIRDQADAVKTLAGRLEDQAYATWLVQRAKDAEAVAADKSANAERDQAAGLAEQMRANETRMTDLQDAKALINATPIDLKVAPNPELKGLLTDLNEVEAVIRRINASKIAPGAGAAAEAGSISGMLRNEALKYGRR